MVIQPMSKAEYEKINHLPRASTDARSSKVTPENPIGHSMDQGLLMFKPREAEQAPKKALKPVPV